MGFRLVWVLDLFFYIMSYLMEIVFFLFSRERRKVIKIKRKRVEEKEKKFSFF